MEQIREMYDEAGSFMMVNSPMNVREWCPSCGATVNMVTIDEATMTLFRIGTLRRLAATMVLHCVELPQGRLLVCFNSLPRKLEVEESSAPLLH
ncbi:MAG: hypothetical protein M3430_10915 [Acidobacteriota bacterium]|nr:hypothetical protein [Acidobacteriota bacterium]